MEKMPKPVVNNGRTICSNNVNIVHRTDANNGQCVNSVNSIVLNSDIFQQSMLCLMRLVRCLWRHRGINHHSNSHYRICSNNSRYILCIIMVVICIPFNLCLNISPTHTQQVNHHQTSSTNQNLVNQHSATKILQPFSLTLEELLLETRLEDAMNKLIDAWHSVHVNSKQSDNISDSGNKDKLISLTQQTNVGEKHKNSEYDTKPSIAINRSRRWTPKYSNLKVLDNVNNKTKNNYFDEMEMMPSDDARVYQTYPTGAKDNILVNNKQTREEKIVEHLNKEQKLTLNCSRCVEHDKARSLRIENIKFSILNKLGMERPPNVSLSRIPKIPHLKHFLNNVPPQMMNDGHQNPNNDMDPVSRYLSTHHFGPIYDDTDFGGEEFFVNAEKSISFARERKCSTFKKMPNPT